MDSRVVLRQYRESPFYKNKTTMESTADKPGFSPELWRAQGAYQTLLGHQIFCMDSGGNQSPNAQQPSLLLLHGFPTSSWDWLPIWDDLVKDYRVIALDMLGFGFSDKPNNRNYSIHGQADIVEALVASKRLESFHVLAHDYGDTVAQELLARQLDGSGCGKWLSCCFLKWRIISRDPSRPADSKTVAQPYRRICLTFSQAMLNSAATLARYLVQIPSPQSKSYRIFGG